jgi:hypothetical protein
MQARLDDTEQVPALFRICADQPRSVVNASRYVTSNFLDKERTSHRASNLQLIHQI